MKFKRLLSYVTAVLGMTAALLSSFGSTSMAASKYISDGKPHTEGYIFVGESHAIFASQALDQVIDSEGKVDGTRDAYYTGSITREAVTSSGMPNMFVMNGNVFFAFEGNDPEDGAEQTKKEYIYSDGAGDMGGALVHISEIMAANPNIKHWNIISWHGHVANRQDTADGQVAKYYVDSYKNWIEKDFPEADIYFLSHGIKTKVYRGSKYAGKINDALKKNFPDQYLDFTAYLNERSNSTIDGVHFDNGTYAKLITDVIKTIEERREGALSNMQPDPSLANLGEFDAAYYSATYPDLAANGCVTQQQLLEHYNSYGRFEGRRGHR